jgi:peptidoglycan/LPS O-acetylase OafA/YrhL
MERVKFYQMTSRIPALDGVRAVAALLVMFLHFSLANHVPEAIKHISTFGQTGVDLFFVLSGFLITRILVSSRSSPTYFSHFYIRRALRIMPLYYLFLIL